MNGTLRASVIGLVALAGCDSDQLLLRFHLDQKTQADVRRVETRLALDPADGRHFDIDLPYRSLATGVGMEVRDFDGTGRQILITHDGSLGYEFAPSFVLRLLPPAKVRSPALQVSSLALSADGPIGKAGPIVGRFGPGSGVDLWLNDQRCAGSACGANDQCCDGACRHVSDDMNHCGACGHACGTLGDSCTGGVCRCVGGSACDTGKSCCRTGCFDLTVDPFHCGDCAHPCNPGESCVAGRCQCGTSAPCSGSAALCCQATGTCSTTGSCPCGGTQCVGPSLCCAAACVDVQSDALNCGRCGLACAAPFTCQGGTCSCNGLVCGGSDTCCATGCANLTNDPANCGGCGRTCAPGESCMASQCRCGAATCTSGQECCGVTCRNVLVDVSNCGQCGMLCHAGESCMNGNCNCGGLPACMGNQSCCPDGCRDLSSDYFHCGNCTRVCTAPANVCQAGVCTNASCAPPCTNGNQCVGTSCSCYGGPLCASGLTCCSAGCLNLSNDPAHCGTCTTACDVGGVCVSGTCMPPPCGSPPTVRTLAGNGTSGWVDAVGSSARFAGPLGVGVDMAGNIYVSEESHRIRKITPQAAVSTLAGDGVAGFRDGASARFNRPGGIAVDGSGIAYVADSYNNRIRVIALDGTVSTVAGGTASGWVDGPGASARFFTPRGITFDGSGNLYVADSSNHRIRKVTIAGNTSTVAGDGTAGWMDGLGGIARFNSPEGLAVDAIGNLYVADTLNHRIRKVAPSGQTTTVAGDGTAGWVDGPAASARFSFPQGIGFDTSGILYVADSGNNRVRRITIGGTTTVDTLAGDGVAGLVDGSALSARFVNLVGIAITGCRIYVGDNNNNAVRLVRF